MRLSAVLGLACVLAVACSDSATPPAPPAADAGLPPYPCETVADCAPSLLEHDQCSVLACSVVAPYTARGCVTAPAAAGTPCAEVTDAGVAACEGTCSAWSADGGSRCVLTAPIPPACSPL